MNKLRLHTLVAVLLGIGTSTAFAADAGAGMQESMTEGDQTDHQMALPADDETPDATPMQPMNMDMQGGSPPPDARDPHTYSGGMSIGSGEYSLPGVPRIKFDDEKTFVGLRVERLERIENRGDSSNGGLYDGSLRIGRDYNALVVKAEGDIADSELEEASTEALYSHSVATYWDTQIGARYDSGIGPNRGWLALGLQGLVPYWFEVKATAYIGDEDRTALSLSAEYELLITQRLVMQPSLEASFYGKDDTERDIGSGLSETSTGLRIRYDFSRQIAPYVGIEGVNTFGKTADLLRAAGEPTRNTRYVVGLRFWF